MKYDLPTLRCEGSPEQMGRQHGEGFADLIRAFVPMRFAAATEYLAEREAPGIEALMGPARASYAIFAAWDPCGHAEHEAVAAAAGVDALELFCAGNITDMRDTVVLPAPKSPDPERPASESEGCSAVLIPSPFAADGGAIAGQTWDLNPMDIDYVVAIHRLPTHGPETWSVGVCGCPSLVGMNNAGLAVGTTNVKTRGARPGVGYMNILHRMLAESHAEAARRIVHDAPRSGAHVFWVADPHGTLREWETTPDSFIERRATDAPLCRTNHCLDPSHTAIEGEVPSPSSRSRLHRLRTHVGAGEQTLHTVRSLFADRSDGVHSVCRYPEDEQGTATNACIIAIPLQRTLWACRGPADRGEWVRLPFEREP